MISLYFHIPYCVRKCRYCDFCSVPADETAALYADALIREIALRAEQYPKESAATVFFGGGTPTALPADDLIRVLESADRAFPFTSDAEISVECNPGTATGGSLKKLRSAGFNRLSVGLQSMDDALLKRIGRIHTREDFLRIFREARETGFQNINVDLMHGLPGQSQEQYLSSLDAVCGLGPEHISSYSLILEEGTPLYDDVKSGRETLPDEDAAADMQDAGMAFLESKGYRRYEISNYAKDGFACRHNLTYWNNGAYLGFGVASHSSMPQGNRWYRFADTESIPKYLKTIGKGKIPETERFLINRFEQMFETVMLGLRKTEGINTGLFYDRFGCDVRETYSEAVERTRTRGLLDESDPAFLRLNRRGLDLLNSVLLDFQERNYWELLRS